MPANKTIFRWTTAVVLAAAVTQSAQTSFAFDLNLSCLNRIGRTFGCGWSDGYHACRDSGCQAGADLPPRSYHEKYGCTTCKPKRSSSFLSWLYPSALSGCDGANCDSFGVNCDSNSHIYELPVDQVHRTPGGDAGGYAVANCDSGCDSPYTSIPQMPIGCDAGGCDTPGCDGCDTAAMSTMPAGYGGNYSYGSSQSTPAHMGTYAAPSMPASSATAPSYAVPQHSTYPTQRTGNPGARIPGTGILGSGAHGGTSPGYSTPATQSAAATNSGWQPQAPASPSDIRRPAAQQQPQPATPAAKPAAVPSPVPAAAPNQPKATPPQIGPYDVRAPGTLNIPQAFRNQRKNSSWGLTMPNVQPTPNVPAHPSRLGSKSQTVAHRVADHASSAAAKATEAQAKASTFKASVSEAIHRVVPESLFIRQP